MSAGMLCQELVPDVARGATVEEPDLDQDSVVIRELVAEATSETLLEAETRRWRERARAGVDGVAYDAGELEGVYRQAVATTV